MAYYNSSGGEALSKRGILTLKYPVDKGIVTNWDDAEKLYHHLFYNELRAAPEEHPVLCTEVVQNPRANREKLTQIMFETFAIPAFCLVNESTLALIAAGQQSGLVIDSGEKFTQIVPIHNLKAQRDAVQTLDIGGDQINHYLAKLLTTYRNAAFTTTSEFELVKSIKHSFCFVSQDYKRDIKIESDLFEKYFEFPDGTPFSVGQERFMAPEVMFDPSPLINGEEGVHKKVIKSLEAVDPSIRSQLLKSVVLSGGNTCFPGFAKRVEKEIRNLLPTEEQNELKVIASPNRAVMAWIGGSIFSSNTPSFEQFISKEEYDEFGPSIIHTKCPY